MSGYNDESIFDQLEEVIQTNSSLNDAAQTLQAIGSPSTSIAVLDHGTITSRCYSIAGDTTETVFQACSLSKPITGLVAMKQVERGNLNLDATLDRYLDESSLQSLASPQMRPWLERVTIRHLMSHTAGLGLHGMNGYANGTELPTLDQIIAGSRSVNTAPIQLQTMPGTYTYSGGGMVVLQKILELVSGLSFAELAQESVFQPLGMTRSSFLPPTQDSNCANAYYSSYARCEEPFRYFPESAAAGLWTTPTDMMRAVLAVQKSLDVSPRTQDTDSKIQSTFLHPDLARQMLTDIDAGMALTWRAPRDGVAFGHTGDSAPGWTSSMFGFADLKSLNEVASNSGQNMENLYPELSGICIMTNSKIGAPVYRRLNAAICYLKGWPFVPDLKNPRQLFTPLEDGRRSFGNELDAWLGAYEDGWTLRQSEESVVIQVKNMPTVRLVPGAISSVAGQIVAVLHGMWMWISFKDNAMNEIEVWVEDGDGNCSAETLRRLI